MNACLTVIGGERGSGSGNGRGRASGDNNSTAIGMGTGTGDDRCDQSELGLDDCLTPADLHYHSPSVWAATFACPQTPMAWNSVVPVSMCDISSSDIECIQSTPTTSRGAVEATASRHPELLGLCTQDIFTPPGLPPSTASVAPPKRSQCTCAYEFDVDILSINQNGGARQLGEESVGNLQYVQSLREIWEEEMARRQAKNMKESLAALTPPFTPTSHRPLGLTEMEFATRLESLLSKGEALFGSPSPATDAERQESASNNSFNECAISPKPLSNTGLTPGSGRRQANIASSQWAVKKRNFHDECEVKASQLSQDLVSNRRVANLIPFAIEHTLNDALVPELLDGFLEYSDDDEDDDENMKLSAAQTALELRHIASSQHDVEREVWSSERETIPTVEGSSSSKADAMSAHSFLDHAPHERDVAEAEGRPPRIPKRAKYDESISSAGGRKLYEPFLPSRGIDILQGQGEVSHRRHLSHRKIEYSPVMSPFVEGGEMSEIQNGSDLFMRYLQSPLLLDTQSNSPSLNFVEKDTKRTPSKKVKFTDMHDMNAHSPQDGKAWGVLFSTPLTQYSASPSLPYNQIDLSTQSEVDTRSNQRCASHAYHTRLLRPAFGPPSKEGLQNIMAPSSSLWTLHKLPFFSRKQDVAGAEGGVEYGRNTANSVEQRTESDRGILGSLIDEMRLPNSDAISHSSSRQPLSYNIFQATYGTSSSFCLTPSFCSPARHSVVAEIIARDTSSKSQVGSSSWRQVSQIETPTPTQPLKKKNLGMNVGGKYVDSNSSSNITGSIYTIMSTEVFCCSRGSLLPNPKIPQDVIKCVVWKYLRVATDLKHESTAAVTGIISIANYPPTAQSSYFADMREIRSSLACELQDSTTIDIVGSEADLFLHYIDIVRSKDPDFLVGYEVQKSSIGLMIERGKQLKPPVDLLQQLSRFPQDPPSHRNVTDRHGDSHDSGIWITGRTVFNLWRMLRHEMKLNNYTFNNVCLHLLQIRVPYFDNEQLTRWYNNFATRNRVHKHIFQRVDINLSILNKLDLIRRTAASARLYGIDFYSVLSRGSQYKVEAVMLRVAHKLGCIAPSPSKRQVANQAAMEAIPLVMEPKSNFYVDPVVVLDFQSLYPSMIIAHNLCFSTIIGKMSNGTDSSISDTTERLGTSSFPEELSAYGTYVHARDMSQSGQQAQDLPFLSPNGSVFCRKEVRHGILPLMLKEILDTRLLLKRSMKLHSGPEDEILRRVLDARQLSLKNIANVTYGYTAAGFSGRMPMAELADAIVQCGRSLLEWTIRLINTHPKWRAEVVYGDTDSVFVHLRGRTKSEAFDIGEEIVEAVTSQTPCDVVLKMEKVFLPCVLVSKKRYVGFAFECKKDVAPHFDAKGIEVVRRDQCGIVAKLQEKALRLLFSTKDLSAVKQYLCSQWFKMHEGGDKLPIKDYIFAKEVRFGSYAQDKDGNVTNMPPGAVVSLKAMLVDSRMEPPYRWRVPYVVVIGSHRSVALKELVVSPYEVLRRDQSLRLNHLYYINKCIIPALHRVLCFSGADIANWYRSMLKPSSIHRPVINHQLILSEAEANKKDSSFVSSSTKKTGGRFLQSVITDFMHTKTCAVCGSKGCSAILCASCLAHKQISLDIMLSRIVEADEFENFLHSSCRDCSRHLNPSQLFSLDTYVGKDCCNSLDCNIFFERCRIVSRRENRRAELIQACPIFDGELLSNHLTRLENQFISQLFN